MNLRKLLCGLLALCLLLTMAPAALMEEAAPEEQVVELGGEETSEPLTAENEGTLDNINDELYDNSVLKLQAYDSYRIYAMPGYEFVTTTGGVKVLKGGSYFNVDDVDVDHIDVSANGKSGKGNLQVKQTNGLETVSYIVNIDVTNKAAPSSVEIWSVADAKKITKKTMDVQADATYEVGAIGLPGKTPVAVAGIKYWTTSNADVVAIDNSTSKKTAAGEQTVTLYAKKAGNATIRVYTANGKHATLEVKVKDKHAITSVSLSASKKKISTTDAGVKVTATVKPTEWNIQEVKWSLSNTKYATLMNTDGTAYVAKTYQDEVVVVPKKAGKVKVKAESRNGKKADIEIEITSASTVKTIAGIATSFGDEIEKDEVYEVELYTPTSKPTSPTKASMLVEVDLRDQNDVWINNYSSAYGDKAAYNKVEWKSDSSCVSISRTTTPGVVKFSFKKTGTAKITVKHPDAKKSYTFKVKVVNSHDADVVFIDAPEDPIVVYTGDKIDVMDYIDIITKGAEPYYGKVTVKRYDTEKVTVDGTIVTIGDRTGKATLKVKAGDKTAKIYLKIK